MSGKKDGNQFSSAKLRHLTAEKERELIYQESQVAKEAIAEKSKIRIGSDKFVSQTLDTVVESELKRQTVGMPYP